MSSDYQASLRTFDERAEGMAEQLASTSLAALTGQYDRGNSSPEALITAPAEMTQSIIEAAGNEVDLAERMITTVLKKAQERIKIVLMCNSVELYPADTLRDVEYGKPVTLKAHAYF